jgi:hypothetical protein
MFVLAPGWCVGVSGRALVAVRDNQIAARRSGVDLAATRRGVRDQRRIRRRRRLDVHDRGRLRRAGVVHARAVVRVPGRDRGRRAGDVAGAVFGALFIEFVPV